MTRQVGRFIEAREPEVRAVAFEVMMAAYEKVSQSGSQSLARDAQPPP